MSKDMLGIAVRKLVTLSSNVLGLVCDLLEKLSDPEWVEATKKFLRKENPWPEINFPLWRALTIGSVPVDKLLEWLESTGCDVSSWARDVIGKSQFTTLPEPTQIQLAKVRVKDLGFTEMPTTTELFARIQEIGSLCPAEVGPHLRLADQDQPLGTGYWIAMEPITVSGGCPGVFHVGRFGDGARWLRAFYAGPGFRWGLGDRVVFRLSK